MRCRMPGEEARSRTGMIARKASARRGEVASNSNDGGAKLHEPVPLVVVIHCNLDVVKSQIKDIIYESRV